MNYYCNPLNLEYRMQYAEDERKDGKRIFRGFREAADPSMVFFKDKYWLFPSMSGGFWVSEDLAEWQFHKYPDNIPVYDYAPDVTVIGDYIYFCASNSKRNCPFFRSKDPLTEPFEEIPGGFMFWDPALFADDDGRRYIYWGCSSGNPIYGVELDAETMLPLGEPVPVFDSDTETRGYERRGDDHIEGLNDSMGGRPYIEGAWMTKHDGKYYLQYAIPGTEFNIYGDGVCVGSSPLGPFTVAKSNPYSYKPGGFINGAGHGSTMKDGAGNYWHISTMRISYIRMLERRLGLWKAGFDEKGELFCDQRYGDWPIRVDAAPWDKPDWMLLSWNKKVTVSSGSGAENITDENIRTWWKADTLQDEWAEVDLGEVMDVRAVQVNFAEDQLYQELPDLKETMTGMGEDRYMDMTTPYTLQWILEYSNDGHNYTVLRDRSAIPSEYTHDFILREEGIRARYLRLRIISVSYGDAVCVSGLRIFGNGNGSAPEPASHVTCERSGDLDLNVSWKSTGATGCNVLWGRSEDQLYHSYMVFGKNSVHIGALLKDEPLCLRIDTFNENGITEGTVQKVY